MRAHGEAIQLAGRLDFEAQAALPLRFEEPKFFLDHDEVPLGAPGMRGRLDLAMYARLTDIGGRPVLRYPDRKFFLLGKYLPAGPDECAWLWLRPAAPAIVKKAGKSFACTRIQNSLK